MNCNNSSNPNEGNTAPHHPQTIDPQQEYLEEDSIDYGPMPKLPLWIRIQELYYSIWHFVRHSVWHGNYKKWVTHWWLKCTNKQIELTGECHLCGACCRTIHLQTANGWIRTLEEFESLCAYNPEYFRYEPKGYDANGFLTFACNWLQPNNTCKDHANRLDTCKAYPNKELLYFEGNPVPECGYAGVAVGKKSN
jgi:uncharacterized protein